MSLIKQILDYEEKIHLEYMDKRKCMISELEQINYDSYDNDLLLNMVFDIKNVIDPIKNSTTAIDFFIENKNKNFISKESVQDTEEITKFLQFFLYFSPYFNLSSNKKIDVHDID